MPITIYNEFTNYAKVLVFVKFKDAAHFEAKGKDVEELPFQPGSTIIKLFQDVPRADLEMLFPNARVRMRLLDKLLIGVPAVVSGIIMVVTKLIAALIPVLLLLGCVAGGSPAGLGRTAGGQWWAQQCICYT